MVTGTSLGTFNHWRHEADSLPVPQISGERCISPDGVPFQVRAGTDEHGNALLAWEVCNSEWGLCGLFFRPTPFPLQ